MCSHDMLVKLRNCSRCYYICIHIHTYIHTYMHAFKHACIHTHTHTHTHTLDSFSNKRATHWMMLASVETLFE